MATPYKNNFRDWKYGYNGGEFGFFFHTIEDIASIYRAAFRTAMNLTTAA